MLALIAGEGALPGLIAPEAGFTAALAGNPPQIPTDVTFRLEHLGTLLQTLKDKGVTEVCFAGAVKRPAFDPSQIDRATLPLVQRLAATFEQGDDAALRGILEIFEEAGFTIHAAHQLIPEVLPDPGVPTERQPDGMAKASAARAAEVLAIIAPADIGQGCVAHKGQIIAIEAALGTAWMLESLQNRTDGAGGLFYKAPKTNQDRRVDLPTIGPDTVSQAADAKLDGIVIEAGGVMILDQARTVAEADARGLFLWVRTP